MKTSFVNVSICKGNIKSKKNTYYARVCKTGRVGIEELLSILKSKAPYIDINMMRAGMEKMQEIIVELVASGKDVDIFNLGTFSLASEGAIEVNSSMQSYLDDGEIEEENADFDISEAVLTQPKFSLKFSPSTSCKKAYQNVKMALALKKRRAPFIKKIENAIPEGGESSVSILKVKGENLKIVGDRKETGVYIKKENGEEIKIGKENIIANTPKMLVILLNTKLKKDMSYTLSILTQYIGAGSSCTASILRSEKSQFVWNNESGDKRDSAINDETKNEGKCKVIQGLKEMKEHIFKKQYREYNCKSKVA